MLRVSVLELPAAWQRPTLMLALVRAALARGPSDLVVLPEASLTGYVSPEGESDLSAFAEPLDGPSAGALGRLARQHRTHLVAPLVLREAGELFNAAVCFDPGGVPRCVYRKRHPWFPEAWATPGPGALPLLEIAGRRVTFAICYDVHFLETESAEQLEAADLLVFPSAWVEDSPEDTRRPLLQQLARRFGCAVANANWGPGELLMPGQGGSCILDAKGELLAEVRRGDLRADAALP